MSYTKNSEPPLSFSQERIWALDRIGRSGDASGNIPFAMRINGNLDMPALEKSLNEIIRRHEVFRTSCKTVDETPRQSILPQSRFMISLEDLRELPESEKKVSMSRLVAEQAALPFDLSKAPLLRAKLLRVLDDEHIFLLTTHVYVFDGWSTSVFFNEISECYQAYSKNENPRLPDLAMQYADFAKWHRDWLSGEVLEKQTSFWMQRLAGAGTLVNLPLDHPLPAISGNKTSIIQFAVPDFLVKSFRKLTEQEGATLFMTLLAVFQTLLHRYANQDDIITGAIVSNRKLEETENMIGSFSNNILIRSDFSGDPNFAELIGRMRKTAGQAYSNQDVPFEELQEKLDPALRRQPLFRVMFLLHQHPGKPGLALPGLKVEKIESSNGCSKYDLNLVMTDAQGNLSGSLEYNEDIFEASTIMEMISRFLKILKKVTNNPKIPVSALPDFTKSGSAVPDAEPLQKFSHAKYRSPGTSTEYAISEIWRKLLGLERVGIDDNFFHIGGHSLLVTRVISRLRKTFEIEMPIRELFELPTVAGMAKLTEAARQAGEKSEYSDIEPISGDGEIPLSFAQQRLWFLDQMESGSPFYNITSAYRLSGALNTGALEQSLNHLIARHETLRTIFESVEGAAKQVVRRDIGFELKKTDLRGESDEKAENKLSVIIEDEAETTFDLSRGPLFRALLIRLKDSENVLVLNMHHIISDGWSMGVLFKELSACYDSYSRGEAPDLAPLEIQYPDFALWQRNQLEGETLEKQLAYWKKNLDNSEESLELPADHSRPPVLTYKGDTKSFALSEKLVNSLSLFSNNRDVTLFMTLLAAFNVLLHRYTGKEDILIGSPIAGRTREDIEGLIGFFANTLVLRADLSANPNFPELLAKVKETALDAYTHQDVPFEKLVEELSPERNLSHTPLFQVMFAFQDAPVSGKKFSDLAVRQLNIAEKTAKFDLTLSMIQDKKEMRGNFNFNTDLFGHDTIERMIGHFKTLLNGIAENPDRKISDLPILTEAETKRILIEFNETEAEYPQDKCIHQLFEEQVEKTPNAVAVVFEDESITYRKLDERANQLGHYLRSLGVGPEILVGICMERSIEMIVGILGILKAGGAYVPLDPIFPHERLKIMTEESEADVVLTQSALKKSSKKEGVKTVSIDKIRTDLNEYAKKNPGASVTSENRAYVMFTSGSTGRPKGVQILHTNVVNFLNSMQKKPGFSVEDTLLSVTTISFDISVLEFFLPLCSGGVLVIASSEASMDGAKLQNLLSSCNVTVMQATPATWKILEESGWEGDLKLRALCGGEALPQNLAEILLKKTGSLWNMYGPTETTIWSTLEHIHKKDGISIGYPIDNTSVYILDAHQLPVPIGVAGILHIGGAGVSSGYLKRSDLTSEKFIHNPFEDDISSRIYNTGDMARYLPDGKIECLGRIDSQVKIRGFRIELGEIEAAVSTHPNINENVAVVTKTSFDDKQLVAYIVLKEKEKTTESEIREYLRQQLPEYMIPTRFIFIKAMPLTPNGKINRKALPKPNLKKNRQGYIQPRTSLEHELSRIWEDMLDVNPVGIFDNFFEIGGHSLLAVQLISKIKKRFKKELPIAALFQNNTIDKLALVIGSESIPGKWSPLVNIRTQGSEQPVFCVHAAGGTVFYFIRFAALLEYDGPFYGLQAKGLEKGDEPLVSIEEMATTYIEAVKKAQPNGPYILSGWSMGAVIAFEMACLLQKEGQQISSLIMIDPPPSNMRHDQVLEDDAEFMVERWEHRMPLSIEEVTDKGGKEEQLAYIFKKMKTEELIPSDIDLSDFKYFFKLHKLNNYIICEYRPRSVYKGKIFLIRVMEMLPYDLRMDEPSEDWKKFATRGLEVYNVPGNHFTVFNESNAPHVAEKMKICIEKAKTEFRKKDENN